MYEIVARLLQYRHADIGTISPQWKYVIHLSEMYNILQCHHSFAFSWKDVWHSLPLALSLALLYEHLYSTPWMRHVHSEILRSRFLFESVQWHTIVIEHFQTQIDYVISRSVCDASREYRCSYSNAKRSFYRVFNAMFGSCASEEVVVELLKMKCLPVLLYGLESLTHSLDRLTGDGS